MLLPLQQLAVGALLWAPYARPAGRVTGSVVAAQAPSSEFSRLMSVGGLRKQATRSALAATEEECAALAARFEFEGIGSLEANVSLAVVDPRRTRVKAYGSLRASNVRVKSMGSASEVQVDGASFETFFIDESMLAAPKSGRYETGDEEAYDEPIEDGQIDMGELVAQHLYLYVSEEQQGEMREAASEFAPGEVVLDTGDDLE